MVVYIYAKKQENSRKLFLIKQIADYFELLKQGYGNDISSRQRNLDGSKSELKINESFFNQKNTVALHIFNSINELVDKINPLLVDFIKDVSIHALGFPEVKKNIHGEYLEPDYSQYRVFLHGMDVALEFLKKKIELILIHYLKKRKRYWNFRKNLKKIKIEKTFSTLYTV